MQVGEPSGAAGRADPSTEVEFAAELVSVTFLSPVKVTLAGAEISGPHWEQGKQAELTDEWSAIAARMGVSPESYSKRPAVYLVDGVGVTHDVEIKVKISKNQNVGGDGRLQGRLHGLEIEGTCPTSAGEHLVVARIVNPPEAIQVLRGRINWILSVESANTDVGLGTSLAEIYFVLGTPKRPFMKGVWTEALRFLCGRVGVVGDRSRRGIATKIAVYCHSRHSLRYETISGRSRFGVEGHGGAFWLTGYMLRLNARCNCYDQAAAIQVLAAALGIGLGWRYLSPFGFIKPTNLVGVGICNNPFFKDKESRKLVAPESPGRSAFGNHAFVGGEGGGILDGCAGPHLGEETPLEYLSSSIDDTPSLYHRGFRPGRASEIVRGNGIVSVF